jgi:hypothetical protein
MAVRQLLALVGAAIAAAAIAAAAFGIVSVLPKPTRGDSLAVNLLDVLRQRRGSGSVMSIDGARVRARCTRIGRFRERVTLADGTVFVLRNSHVVARTERATPLAAVRVRRHALVAAEADLAGSYALYSAEVLAQLQRGIRISARHAIVDGKRAFSIALREKPPYVNLLVSRPSLQPLAVEFRSAEIDAHARIVSSGKARFGC